MYAHRVVLLYPATYWSWMSPSRNNYVHTGQTSSAHMWMTVTNIRLREFLLIRSDTHIMCLPVRTKRGHVILPVHEEMRPVFFRRPLQECPSHPKQLVRSVFSWQGPRVSRRQRTGCKEHGCRLSTPSGRLPGEEKRDTICTSNNDFFRPNKRGRGCGGRLGAGEGDGLTLRVERGGYALRPASEFVMTTARILHLRRS